MTMDALGSLALPIVSALFDSVWQGAIVVAAVWLGLRAAPRLGASTRYAIWMCALAALAVLPVATLFDAAPAATSAPIVQTAPSAGAATKVAQPQKQPQPATHADRAVAAVTASDVAVAAVAPKARIDVSKWFALAVALAWLAAAGLRGSLLVANLIDLARIRRKAQMWTTKHHARILLSTRVRTPIAIGFLRPAVLLPAALVDELAPEAIDAIVVHEVAHLQRFDVWTNAFARIVEALVALNPVVWFVSRRIAVEREIACDDWVVSRLGAGEMFARTLADLASTCRMSAPLAAPSAIGSKHAVVERVERLLDSAPRKLRISASVIVATLALIGAIAVVARSVSPVLAYQPSSGGADVASTNGSCSLPNRGLMIASPLGLERATGIRWYAVQDASAIVRTFGAAKVALVDLTVNTHGVVSKVMVRMPNDGYPGGVEYVGNIFAHASYQPALRDCTPVETTVHTGLGLQKMLGNSLTTVTPIYPNGWGAAHPASCRVPQLLHTGVPAFPQALASMPIGEQHSASARVSVGANGSVTDASIVTSSGVPALDSALLSAARAPAYPLDESTGFKPVRPSNATLEWNATHGYALYSKCTPRPAQYVWDTTFKQVLPRGFPGSSMYAIIEGF